MFKKDKTLEEGMHVFLSVPDKEFTNIIFGTITGVENQNIGINGVMIDPVGLKNKIRQSKAGSRSQEILTNPTSENCIHAFIYRTEHENYTGVINLDEQNITPISPKTYSILDGWIRESIPEFINNVLSLPPGDERDQKKHLLRNKMDNLYDKDLKRNLYSVCRSLKILV